MKWRVRTAAMFIVLSTIMLAIGLFVGYLLEYEWEVYNGRWFGLALMLVLSVILNLYAYFGSKKSALRANKAKIVTATEEPRLYRIVMNVAQRAGVPMPEVGITETNMLNAFATGRNPKNAAVVVTRGLLNVLPDDELEGVIAHEMAHIRNRDILIMSVASTIASVLTYLTVFAMLGARAGGNNKNGGIIVLIAILLYFLVPIAALLIRMGVSRSREYLADESGAKITGNPRALARALRSIETGAGALKNDYSNNNYANMWISNPVRKVSVTQRMFSTHPPMDERVSRLEDLAMKMDSGQVPRFGIAANKKKSNYL
jgi:heat shock protein HtpX